MGTPREPLFKQRVFIIPILIGIIVSIFPAVVSMNWIGVLICWLILMVCLLWLIAIIGFSKRLRNIILIIAFILLNIGGFYRVKKQIIGEVEERPYFTIYSEIIKATPELKAEWGSDYIIKTTVNNVGKHVANNIYNRQIFIDQPFQLKPVVLDSSKGNEIIANGKSVCFNSINFPPEIVPSYMVFAIKYQDKEVLSQKTFHQIWYFKQRGGNDKNPPLKFMDTSISERENILSHLKEELRSYQ